MRTSVASFSTACVSIAVATLLAIVALLAGLLDDITKPLRRTRFRKAPIRRSTMGPISSQLAVSSTPTYSRTRHQTTPSSDWATDTTLALLGGRAGLRVSKSPYVLSELRPPPATRRDVRPRASRIQGLTGRGQRGQENWIRSGSPCWNGPCRQPEWTLDCGKRGIQIWIWTSGKWETSSRIVATSSKSQPLEPSRLIGQTHAHR